MLSVEENNMSSITKESATFTTKKKSAFGEGAGANSATP